MGGQVCFREFLATIRRQPTLQALLCEVTGVPFGQEERLQQAKLAGSALVVSERTDALLKERKRLKEVFARLRGDESGTCASGFLDWPQFLAFFQQHGRVLD